jgi:sugar lactone lactonase YvrE
MRRVALPLLILAALAAAPTSADAVPLSERQPSIVLPGATSAEGIAKGQGSTFYAGDLFAGDIFRGNVRSRTAEMFIDAPDGRMALGMAFTARRHLLFVAGGATGQAYVYDTRSGDTVASYQFAGAGTSLINDVTLTSHGAWFTDSLEPVLYFVPLSNVGDGTFETLQLSGPAAELSGAFNLNGIRATRGGHTLIVAHSTNGALYTVDSDTGDSAAIAGISVPNVDGIELAGDNLWAVQNFSNQITRISLSDDLTTGTVEKVIRSELFQVPTTAARFGNTFAVMNAKFDTGFPPTADEYEVVIVGD